MLKSKIFHGNFYIEVNGKEQRADDAFNEWMKGKNIKIKDVIYQHPEGGIHSICVIYSDNEREIKIEKFPITQACTFYVDINKGRLIRRYDNADFSHMVKDFSEFRKLSVDFDGDFIEYDQECFIRTITQKQSGIKNYSIKIYDVLKEEYL